MLVGVFFFITPLFDDGSTGYPTWVILNWFMAPGVAIACAASLRWKLALSTGSEPDIRNYIGDNVLFYSALVLALWYLSNWLGDMVGEEVPLLWSFIDPPLCCGHRRLRHAALAFRRFIITLSIALQCARQHQGRVGFEG